MKGKEFKWEDVSVSIFGIEIKNLPSAEVAGNDNPELTRFEVKPIKIDEKAIELSRNLQNEFLESINKY